MRKPERWLNMFQEELVRKEVRLFDLVQKLYQQKNRDLEVSAGKLQALSPWLPCPGIQYLQEK